MRRLKLEDGIVQFLDGDYGDFGGYKRWTEVLKLRWPNTEIGREFDNVTRETIRSWKIQTVKDGLWNEKLYGPALTNQDSASS